MKRIASHGKQASRTSAISLADIKVVQLTGLPHQRRLQSLLRKHHYLGSLQPGGEQMLYAAVAPTGRWLAVGVFSAAAKPLKARDKWIGWTQAQRDHRLSLVANNSRFLILPEGHQPDLGSRVLRWARDRLSTDW